MKTYAELWTFRRYIWTNSLADLKVRYAGSALGVFWNIANPLFQILIFAFVFSTIMVAKIPGINSAGAFTVYLCSGILPWTAFADTLIRGSTALVTNATYLKKLPVPEHIFVACVAGSSGILMFISVTLLVPVTLLEGGRVTLSWVLLVPTLGLIQIFAFGLGVLFAVLNVFYRDIGQLVGTLVQVWMWVTPIVYLKQILPDFLRNWVTVNPMYWYVDSIHQIVVFKTLPSLLHWALMTTFSSVSLGVGLWVLARLKTEIRDVL